MGKPKRYNEEGVRLTDCCGAISTFMECNNYPGHEVLCCKVCFCEVPIGQGDGSEVKPKEEGNG